MSYLTSYNFFETMHLYIQIIIHGTVRSVIKTTFLVVIYLDHSLVVIHLNYRIEPK